MYKHINIYILRNFTALIGNNVVIKINTDNKPPIHSVNFHEYNLRTKLISFQRLNKYNKKHPEDWWYVSWKNQVHNVGFQYQITVGAVKKIKLARSISHGFLCRNIEYEEGGPMVKRPTKEGIKRKESELGSCLGVRRIWNELIRSGYSEMEVQIPYEYLEEG